MLRMRCEDKGPIAAVRWRGVSGLDAVGSLVADGRPGSTARAGVRSEEGRRSIAVRACLLAGGVEGLVCVPEDLLRAAR